MNKAESSALNYETFLQPAVTLLDKKLILTSAGKHPTAFLHTSWKALRIQITQQFFLSALGALRKRMLIQMNEIVEMVTGHTQLSYSLLWQKR
jgi:hypothetical protein